MSRARTRGRPLGRRSGLIAVLLSVLLPGLGHAYALHLPRALVWFGGTIVVGIVLSKGDESTPRALVVPGALAVLAAADVLLAMWLDGRSAGHR